MRIDEQEKRALDHALSRVEGEAYLFGSRVDDRARGGDIDVLIVTQEDSFDVSRRVTVDFKMECDERIDVRAMQPEEKRDDYQEAFLNTLELVRLK